MPNKYDYDVPEQVKRIVIGNNLISPRKMNQWNDVLYHNSIDIMVYHDWLKNASLMYDMMILMK